MQPLNVSTGKQPHSRQIGKNGTIPIGEISTI
jgi:hypothetical protein